MVDSAQVYDQRIYDYLRWITKHPELTSLSDAWSAWRGALPHDLLQMTQTLSRIFQASAEHERERMVAEYPIKTIDSILPGSVGGLQIEHTAHERKAYRQYIHNLALIASSLDPAVRNRVMSAIIPQHISRSIRDTLHTHPGYIDGIIRAAQCAPSTPRPQHRRHTTAVHSTQATRNIDWGISIHPRTGAYTVHWEKVRPATAQRLYGRQVILLIDGATTVTVLVEPSSVFEREHYFPIPISKLQRCVDQSAVPVILYDDGTLAQVAVTHAQPLVRVRLLGRSLEVVPVSSRVLTLIYEEPTLL